MARLAAGEQLAKVDVLVELEADGPSRIQTTVDGIFCDESSIETASPTATGWPTSAIRPPAETLRTRINCSPLVASTSLATRSIGNEALVRRGAPHGRGTAVLSENVVDSKATSSSPSGRCGLLAPNERTEHAKASPKANENRVKAGH